MSIVQIFPLNKIMASEGGVPGCFEGATICGTGDHTSVFFDLSASDSWAHALWMWANRKQEENNAFLFMILLKLCDICT
jgi:hypothetical protein